MNDSDFIGRCPTNVERPIKIIKESRNHHTSEAAVRRWSIQNTCF